MTIFLSSILNWTLTYFVKIDLTSWVNLDNLVFVSFDFKLMLTSASTSRLLKLPIYETWVKPPLLPEHVTCEDATPAVWKLESYGLKPRPHYAGGIWKRTLFSENASNVFCPHYTSLRHRQTKPLVYRGFRDRSRCNAGYTALEKFENPAITGNFGFVFWKNKPSAMEITVMIIVRSSCWSSSVNCENVFFHTEMKSRRFHIPAVRRVFL